MAYKTYTSRAVVWGRRPSNTSDRAYLLFTENAGMLWATARSVREERSNQRHALHDFGVVRVSLVKGKNGWRIGSVEAEINPFMGARERSERAFITGVVSLLRRYIHGEEALPEVFADVIEVLVSDDTLPEETLSIFEGRLLFRLGHLQTEAETSSILEAKNVSDAVAMTNEKTLQKLTKVIHHAHQQSQL